MPRDWDDVDCARDDQSKFKRFIGTSACSHIFTHSRKQYSLQDFVTNRITRGHLRALCIDHATG